MMRSVMIRRFPRLPVLWLLPLLVWQLLLPPGVMPGARAGAAALVLCPMHGAMPAGDPGSVGPVAPGTGTEKYRPSICPFAATGAAAPSLAGLPVAAHDSPPRLDPPAYVSAPWAPPGPVRSQISRAPPRLS